MAERTRYVIVQRHLIPPRQAIYDNLEAAQSALQESRRTNAMPDTLVLVEVVDDPDTGAVRTRDLESGGTTPSR